MPEIKLEVCSSCHPFFTGKEKLVDTEGRVQRFERRMAAKTSPKVKKETEARADKPTSLKEMLQAVRKSG